MLKILKDLYWNLSILPEDQKEKFFYFIRRKIRHEESIVDKKEIYKLYGEYIKQILAIPTYKSITYKEIIKTPYQRAKNDPKIIAYYLPQMHPTPENDAWWGKGVTEWNNVSRAVPQFIGHYQPRLPGELGFYDLRIKENLIRQIELAEMYGIYAFCWYYYWFDGKRLLERPLDMYLSSKEIEFPFCLCWANESWTKGFFGSSQEVIMKQNHTVDSYFRFIEDIAKYLKDDRYVMIDGKKLLIVYKPQNIPDCNIVLNYWREYCKKMDIGNLYLVGCWTSDQSADFISYGFDAIAEFQPGSIMKYCVKKNQTVPFVNKNFSGVVYSYKDIIDNAIYKKNFVKKKMYHAVMPMWDNTPRRNDKGNVIYHGSTPALYKFWLKDIILQNKNEELEDRLIFLNAWNEWGEGAYLEPDKRYGYAYLQATKEAIEESREES
ncbi:glycoside hydrolase family 99-like domain-containing protein [Megasphaera stantonii]|uniref:glycosyltransferase WbsX family protein n=1 Tax=Megasphaera stantonii TaxID=2144175 RepID=UPI0023F46DB6|nr:glycoside hydrolase family 99-like domain-containing protein [Megasphaera stantonii]